MTSDRRTAPPVAAPRPCVPIGGGDVEVGNFIQGRPGATDTCDEAARALVAEIEGHPCVVREPISGNGVASSAVIAEDPRQAAFDPQDRCRRYLATNGGCIYVDLSHLELCLAEVTCASDYLLHWHAMLRIAREAQVRAEDRLSPGERLQVLVNNSDGRGHAYGAHLNFMIPRRLFEDLFYHRVHLMLFLASYQVSSIIFTGQGKVGSEHGRPPVDFQIAQRADFFEMPAGPQTTFRRPLVNMRDEPLCGPTADGLNRRWARLHMIFYDATLCHVSTWLRFGVTQVVLSMIAADHFDLDLILEDPVSAVVAWSHDITLTRRMRTLRGGDVTAVDLQMRLLEMARRFVESGARLVPEAEAILAAWDETLTRLKVGALDALAGRLDWVLKLATLQVAVRERGLAWSAPEVKFLDHLYGSLDPQEGLFWSMQRSGVVERMVSDAQIERAMAEPPDDTRAWTRAMLLRRADPLEVERVDWDEIRFNLFEGRAGLRSRTVHLSDPLQFTRARTEDLFADASDLPTVLDGLEERFDASVTDTNDPTTPRTPGTGGTSADHHHP